MTKNDRRQHSRRSLLWLALIALLAQLGGGLLLDDVWPDVRFPDAAAVRRQLRKVAPPPTFVCLGSSRFQESFRHDIVNPLLRQATGKPVYLFNAAVPAADAFVFDLLLDEVLRLEPPPRLLLVEVSPETLSRFSQFLPMHLLRQVRWRDVPAIARELKDNNNRLRLAQARLLPLWVHRLEMKHHFVPLLCPRGTELLRVPYPSAEQPATPVAPLVEQPGVRAGLETTRSILRRLKHDYVFDGLCSRSLERVLERCRAHGLEVLLVGIPASAPYREDQGPAVMEAYRAYLADLRARFGCGFVDLRQRLPDEGFRDALHPTAEGAVWLGTLLVREVLQPWWRRHRGEDYVEQGWHSHP